MFDGILAIPSLQLDRQLVDHVSIQQFAQFRIAQQFSQLGVIQGQDGGSPFGQRSVAVVEKIRRVIEQQRGGKGRRCGRLYSLHANRPLLHLMQDPLQAVKIEHIAQALAIGFQQDGEPLVAGGDSQQVGRLATLQPQRRAFARSASGQQQRAGGVLAKTRGEQGRTPQFANDDILDFVSCGKNHAEAGGSSDSGSRNTMPSSLHIMSTSPVVSARNRAATAVAQGA